MSRVVCAGHVNWDVSLRVDHLPEPDGEAEIEGQRQSGGGSASNAAVVFAGLDVESWLLGSVGADEHGWLARRELEAADVETLLVEADGSTAVKYLIVDDAGEVMVLGNAGANEAYTAEDLPEATLAEADHLHLTSQAPATAAALAARATDAGVPVSIDPGRRLGERDYGETLPLVDTLFCNEREAARAGGVDAVPTVVTKCGAGGARVRTVEETTEETVEKTVEHPGFAVDPVDTTGAGDAFDAGFIAARLRGESLRDALAIGNACGALAARTIGARVHLEWADVEALRDIGPRA